MHNETFEKYFQVLGITVTQKIELVDIFLVDEHFVSKIKVPPTIGRGPLKQLLLLRPLALKSQLQKTLLQLATGVNITVFATLHLNFSMQRKTPGLGRGCVRLGMLGGHWLLHPLNLLSLCSVPAYWGLKIWSCCLAWEIYKGRKKTVQCHAKTLLWSSHCKL